MLRLLNALYKALSGYLLHNSSKDHHSVSQCRCSAGSNALLHCPSALHSICWHQTIPITQMYHTASAVYTEQT